MHQDHDIPMDMDMDTLMAVNAALARCACFFQHTGQQDFGAAQDVASLLLGLCDKVCIC